MIVGRVLGWLLILAAIAALGWELHGVLQTGSHEPLAAGELWRQLDARSLDAAQAAVRRHLHPDVWDIGLATQLRLPAWTVLGLPGVLLAYAFRGRHRTGRKATAQPAIRDSATS